MSKSLNAALSEEIAQRLSHKAKTSFDNAYEAALLIPGLTYVQGFLVLPCIPYKPMEHCWLEVEDAIVDPALPHLNRAPEEIWYFPAQRLSVKKLKAAIEEAKEDYPEDDPLPVYGAAPYEYYGDAMLGGKDYLDAFQAAEAKCQEINQSELDRN